MSQTDLLEATDRLIEAATTRKKLRRTLPLERRLERQLRKTWRAQGRAVLKALAKLRRKIDAQPAALSEAVQPEELDRPLGQAVKQDPALVAAVELVTERAMVAGGSDVIAELRVEGAFDPAWPDATAYMKDLGAARVTAIDDITRQRMRTVLVRASDHGWSYQQTAKEIRTLFDGFGAARAKLVAVTEIGEAYEHGGRVAASHLAADGLVLEKRWLVAGDERVCPICSPNGAADWRPVGQAFPSGDDGPLAHPGCRCALSRRVKKTTTSAR